MAQTPSTGKSTAYLDQDNPLTPDFTAALMTKSVPVVITTDPLIACYTVTFSMNKNNGSIFDVSGKGISAVQGITSAINNGNYDPGAGTAPPCRWSITRRRPSLIATLARNTRTTPEIP